MNSVKVLLGVFTGVAIGAIVGVLFAPEKGATTRKNISSKSDAYAQQLGNRVKGFVEGITHKFEAMTEEATLAAENGVAKLRKDGGEMIAGHKKS